MSRRIGRNMKSLAVTFLATTVLAVGCQKPVTKPPDSITKVLYTLPVVQEITDFEQFTGRTEAVRSVEVRARVTGYLDKVNFVDGSEVAKDTLLFEIDPRPYQAEFDRATSSLAQAEAKEKHLDADYRRYSALLSRGTSSREEYDKAEGDLAEARAAVGVARAQLALAKLDLSFTKVYAPIEGRLSRRMVDPGNLVKADETMLTTIVSLDPMYVNFDIDERTILRIRRLIREGKVKSRSEAEVAIHAGLADEPDFPHQGTLDFSENKVDPNTGTLRVRGVLKNPTPRVLSPGMFFRVRLPIGKPHPSVMVAEQAVGTDQGKKFLYIVNDKDVIEQRTITVGLLTNDNLRVVESGLKKGERVVISGLQRVRLDKKKVQAESIDEFKTRQANKTKVAADSLSKSHSAASTTPPASPAAPKQPSS